MLLFGHVGLTLGAAIAGAGFWRKLLAGRCLHGETTPDQVTRGRIWDADNLAGVDIRLLLIGSLLPDIIDKPLGALAFANGRIFAHTLLFLILLGFAATLLYIHTRRNWLLVLCAGSAAHLVLDSMWQDPVTLLWPLLGLDFPRTNVADWGAMMLRGLLTDPLIAVSESVGLAISAWFGIVALRRRKVLAFLKRGRLD